MSAAKAKAPPPWEALRRLEEGDLPRALVLTGGEAFFRDHCARAVRSALEDTHRVCLHMGEADGFSPADAVADLETRSLFGEPRLLVLMDVDGFLRRESKDTPLQHALLAWMESPPADEVLVLSGSGLRANSKVAKAATGMDGGRVIACRALYASPPPWDPDPAKAETCVFAMARARVHGVRINGREAVGLCAGLGHDLAAIEGALRTGAETGQLPAGEGPGRGVDAFALAEQIIDGAGAVALAGLERAYRFGLEGTGPGRAGVDMVLLATLAREVRRLSSARAVLEAGGSPGEACDAAGIPASRPIREKFVRRARLGSAGRLGALCRQLEALERQAKTGACPARLAVERLACAAAAQ